MNAADAEIDPVVLIVEAVEAQLDRVAAAAVDTIYAQVPAYATSSDEVLRQNVIKHVAAIQRVLVTTLKEGRTPQRQDFAMTASQAALRVRGGIPLLDFLHAYRINQAALWGAVRDVVREHPETHDAALAMVDQVMQVIEVGSSVAVEEYVRAQQHQLADRDRLRRDLLEELLAGRNISFTPQQEMLHHAGLAPGGQLIVASGVSALPLTDEGTLRDAEAALHRLSAQGFTVVRHNEIVGITPVPAGRSVVQHLRRVVPDLERQGMRLTLGISTVHTGLSEVPEAYAEARAARERLGGSPGVIALPLVSSLDYLVVRSKETAQRLIRPEVRRFVEEDMARGGDLIATLVEYTASDLNAKITAERLHVHANTAYYRLERIAERTGCDLRRFYDVMELLIAVRLLGDHTTQPAS